MGIFYLQNLRPDALNKKCELFKFKIKNKLVKKTQKKFKTNILCENFMIFFRAYGRILVRI